MQKITSRSKVITLILKEIRIERNFHQAQFADFCNKPTSTWTKIEGGQQTLTLEILSKICSQLNIPLSRLFYVVELYENLLISNNWIIRITDDEEDDLLSMAKKYYDSPEFKTARNLSYPSNLYYSILDTPINNCNHLGYFMNDYIIITDVFNYILDYRYVSPNFPSNRIENAYDI